MSMLSAAKGTDLMLRSEEESFGSQEILDKSSAREAAGEDDEAARSAGDG